MIAGESYAGDKGTSETKAASFGFGSSCALNYVA